MAVSGTDSNKRDFIANLTATLADHDRRLQELEWLWLFFSTQVRVLNYPPHIFRKCFPLDECTCTRVLYDLSHLLLATPSMQLPLASDINWKLYGPARFQAGYVELLHSL